MSLRLAAFAAFANAAAWAPTAQAGEAPAAVQAPMPAWVTLGTMGGPVPFAGRSQPTNALLWPQEA